MNKTDTTGRRGRACLAAAALAWVFLGGCGEKVNLPQTYPVRGRVVYKGGVPVAGGVVQFQAHSDPRLLTNGETDVDGAFTLTTQVGGQKLSGAVAGEHQVTVVPPMPADQSAEPIVLPHPYTVEAKDNFFTIEIDKPRRGSAAR